MGSSPSVHFQQDIRSLYVSQNKSGLLAAGLVFALALLAEFAAFPVLLVVANTEELSELARQIADQSEDVV